MFRPRTTGWVGFDLGGSTVKAAQVVRVGGEYRIRAAAIVPRRKRWDADALTAEQPLPSADEMQTAASLCDAPRSGGAAAVLPMMLCDAVQVDAPPASRDAGELTALVEAEMHQSLADYVVGSWPATLQSGKLNVITVPAAWSDQVSGDVAGGRWNCRAIDSLPWALARAVAMVEPPTSPRTVAALDWGYGRATLCLVHDGAPAFVRCLKDCGFQQAVAAIERGLRLTATDAERLLHRHGLAAGDDDGAAVTGVIEEALAEPLHSLERELRRTLSYWQGQSRGVKPESLYLFGGGASLTGLPARLSKALELDVQLWSLAAETATDAQRLPPAHLLGPAVAASALAWEA